MRVPDVEEPPSDTDSKLLELRLSLRSADLSEISVMRFDLGQSFFHGVRRRNTFDRAKMPNELQQAATTPASFRMGLFLGGPFHRCSDSVPNGVYPRKVTSDVAQRESLAQRSLNAVCWAWVIADELKNVRTQRTWL